MDIEKAFANIQMRIRDGEYDKVRPMADEIASSADDIDTLLKCASLLKVVDDEDGCQNILDRVVGMSPDAGDRMTVARSLRGLGRPGEAYEMIKDEEETDAALYEKAETLRLMDESEDALSKMRKIISMTTEHRILLSEILCSLGEFSEAYGISSQLVKDEDGSYRSLVNLCSVMILMGRNKDAIKTAKQYLKEGKDADSLALAAYVMRINGRIPAAANYAHRSLSIDHTHKGALETMAYCLIERSRFLEAKVMAGAINERAPGDPAAIRILDACRQASR
jgi:tetratricopeptide (TPR) repeat protein